MTAAALLRILGRRWYVLAVGLAIVALCFTTMQRAGGAYSTQATVIFVAPGDRGVGETSDGYLNSLVDFAAVVEREYHDGRPADRLAEAASLFGAGVSDGEQVLLVNSGSQWENSFAKPAISIKVVGPTAREVRGRLDRIIRRIGALAAARQAESGVDSTNAIGTERVPEQTVVQYVGSTRGTQARALLALTVVGLGASSAAAVLLDRALARRRGRSLVRAPVWKSPTGIQGGRTP